MIGTIDLNDSCHGESVAWLWRGRKSGAVTHLSRVTVEFKQGALVFETKAGKK